MSPASSPSSAGRTAYEQDVAQRPTYNDGQPRKAWEALSDVARWSWERELQRKTS